MRIVLGNSLLAGYPEAGGLWTLFLAYPLGLRALKHEVLWLELYRTSGRADRDRHLISTFFDRMRQYGMEDGCVLLAVPPEKPVALETAEVHGARSSNLKQFLQSADLLWNFASSLKQPLLSLFKRRVLLDGDPGHWQVSALDFNMGQHDHEVFLTVGSKMRDADCEAPRVGLTWHPFPQIVHLSMWEVTPDPGRGTPFTSVTQWNWGEIWWDKRAFSISKREAYLRCLELPRRTGRPFELAANIHPQDKTGDRELLQQHGWKLVDPNRYCGSPSAYRDYIRRSRSELCCAKPIFRELKTGWLSDRSSCYLASGRPVLAEETGLSDHFPTGNGLLTFRSLDEAVAGVAEIDSNYPHHSRAARRFAEEFLDARICLKKMIAVCT
jgi:hypothetical protein